MYQSLRPYPQYTAVTTGGGVFFGGGQVSGVADPVGQNLFNSLQVKGNHRFSNGLSLFGYATWVEELHAGAGPISGRPALPVGCQQPAFSYSFSWAYRSLPFGRGKASVQHRESRAQRRCLGLEINGFVKYSFRYPSQFVAGGAGNLGAVGYLQRGNAVDGVSPYLVTNLRDFDPATSPLMGTLRPSPPRRVSARQPGPTSAGCVALGQSRSGRHHWTHLQFPRSAVGSRRRC